MGGLIAAYYAIDGGANCPSFRILIRPAASASLRGLECGVLLQPTLRTS